MIVSDLKITRKLYRDMPVYIDNTAPAIQAGVVKAFEEKKGRIDAIRTFGEEYGRNMDAEIATVKILLGLAKQNPSRK